MPPASRRRLLAGESGVLSIKQNAVHPPSCDPGGRTPIRAALSEGLLHAHRAPPHLLPLPRRRPLPQQHPCGRHPRHRQQDSHLQPPVYWRDFLRDWLDGACAGRRAYASVLSRQLLRYARSALAPCSNLFNLTAPLVCSAPCSPRSSSRVKSPPPPALAGLRCVCPGRPGEWLEWREGAACCSALVPCTLFPHPHTRPPSIWHGRHAVQAENENIKPTDTYIHKVRQGTGVFRVLAAQHAPSLLCSARRALAYIAGYWLAHASLSAPLPSQQPVHTRPPRPAPADHSSPAQEEGGAGLAGWHWPHAGPLCQGHRHPRCIAAARRDGVPGRCGPHGGYLLSWQPKKTEEASKRGARTSSAT